MAPSAWAAPGGSGDARRTLDERFKQLDRNSDGKVTAEELGNPDLFKRLDRNGDGSVTLEESREALGARRSERVPSTAAPATIPDPKGGGREVLLGACNFPGVVYRIDFAANPVVATELDIRAYFGNVFGTGSLRGPCLTAYNNFLPATHPDTGERVHLLGLWINHPAGRGTDEGGSAWYLVRHADGTYGHGRVFDPKVPRPIPPRGLLATRSIEVSPFPEDRGRVLYFGGFDCASIESRDSAWIYRGELPPAKGPETR